MKSTIQRVLFAVAVATLGAGAVGTESAQSSSSAPGTSPPHHLRHGHFRHFGGSPFVGTLLQATRQLGKAPGTQSLALSTGQQETIKSILTEARPHHQPGSGPKGPGITVLGNPGDPGYSAAVAAAEAAATARIQTQTTLATDIWNVLSTNQKNALPNILAAIQAKQEARRGQWAAKHATGNG